MKNAHLFTALAMCFVLVIMMAGCQANDEETSVNDNEENGVNSRESSEVAEEDNDTNDSGEAEQEPVTLKVYNGSAGIWGEDDLNALIADPVQEVYPDISFELMDGELELEDILLAGDVPDIIADSNVNLYDLIDMGVASDLTDMINQKQIDLTRFDPVLFETLDQFAENGEIYGFPFAMNYGTIAYNKDIFDRFAVPYPTDNMTWNEFIDLGRELTVEDDGVQYYGMQPTYASWLVRAHSLPYVDEDEEVVISDDEYVEQYAEAFDLIQQMQSIPGMIGDDGEPLLQDFNDFVVEETLAIFPNWIAALTSSFPNVEMDSWDLVSWPSFESKPGIGREVDFHMLIVPPTSENQEAAHRVIETIVSEDAQKNMNRGSRLTVIDDIGLRADHAADLDIYDGKNLEGIFSVSPAPAPPHTPYTNEVNGIVNEVAAQMGREGLDVNSALQLLEEQANGTITEIRSRGN